LVSAFLVLASCEKPGTASVKKQETKQGAVLDAHNDGVYKTTILRWGEMVTGMSGK